MVFVSASADESCNLPMMEANAMGIPAVVFDCRGDYSDHCEYIKYGIVVNIKEQNKVNKDEEVIFQMAMEWIQHYHFCSRVLKIKTIVPNIPKTKFYDFPLSYAELMAKFPKLTLSVKQFHRQAQKYCFGGILNDKITE